MEKGDKKWNEMIANPCIINLCFYMAVLSSLFLYLFLKNLSIKEGAKICLN